MAFGFGASIASTKAVVGGGGGVTTGILLSNEIDFLMMETGDYLLQG